MNESQDWKNDASCKNFDTEFFFDKYEEDVKLRPAIDALCSKCPVARQCFATGVSTKAYGVWGGVYLENGKISKEFSSHRTKQQWGETWKSLTNDKDKQ